MDDIFNKKPHEYGKECETLLLPYLEKQFETTLYKNYGNTKSDIISACGRVNILLKVSRTGKCKQHLGNLTIHVLLLLCDGLFDTDSLMWFSENIVRNPSPKQQIPDEIIYIIKNNLYKIFEYLFIGDDINNRPTHIVHYTHNTESYTIHTYTDILSKLYSIQLSVRGKGTNIFIKHMNKTLISFSRRYDRDGTYECKMYPHTLDYIFSITVP